MTFVHGKESDQPAHVTAPIFAVGLGGSVGCFVRLETRRPRVQPPLRSQHSFVEIDHEIFSMVILSLPLIKEGHLSVSGERMCTILVNHLEDSLPSKRVVR